MAVTADMQNALHNRSSKGKLPGEVQPFPTADSAHRSPAPSPAVIIAVYKSIAITSPVFADYTQPFVLFTTRLRHVPAPSPVPDTLRHLDTEKNPIFG